MKYFTNTGVDPHDCIYLSALAMGIFKTKFMKLENICNITGETYKLLKISYYGWHSDFILSPLLLLFICVGSVSLWR